MWKIGTVHGYNRGWTSDIYTEKTPDFRRFKYSFNKRSLHLILLYPLTNEKFNQNIIHWTITLITPLFGIVHFKTNYNYRLSNHCLINDLILVTYALISTAIEKIFLSGTTKLRALIFSMKHHLVNFYQVCPTIFPWSQKFPSPWGHMFNIGLYREKNEAKKISSETTRPRVFMFGMYHNLVDLYQVCSNYIPGAKTGTAPGLTRYMVIFQQIPICKL